MTGQQEDPRVEVVGARDSCTPGHENADGDTGATSCIGHGKRNSLVTYIAYTVSEGKMKN